MTKDLDLFGKTIASIKNDTYTVGVTDRILTNVCENLKQSAEIFVVLHPDLSLDYLMERRLILYGVLSNEEISDFKPDREQELQLQFVNEEIFGLLLLYGELFEELNKGLHKN